jgi:hypothetical protein
MPMPHPHASQQTKFQVLCAKFIESQQHRKHRDQLDRTEKRDSKTKNLAQKVSLEQTKPLIGQRILKPLQ